MYQQITLALLALMVSLVSVVRADDAKLRALIIDGQNNHAVWPKTTQLMKGYLEQTGLFAVEISTTAKQGTDPSFQPEFSKYQVVVSNYNGAEWPAATQKAFTDYIRGGGGFVVIHAANNAFGKWSEYNQMIGLGGWGGRNEQSGPYVYVDEQGKLVRDNSQGNGGHHGPQHPFSIIVRNAQHPVTEGMPREWLHTNDELYDLLRGPADNIQVLATAFADKAKGGSGRHEPMIFTVQFGSGRVFHTPLGHGVDSQSCVGFITTLQRGSEWAATGRVTQSLPADFPSADKISQRKAAE